MGQHLSNGGFCNESGTINLTMKNLFYCHTGPELDPGSQNPFWLRTELVLSDLMVSDMEITAQSTNSYVPTSQLHQHPNTPSQSGMVTMWYDSPGGGGLW